MVSVDRYCSSNGVLDILKNKFLRSAILDLAKNVLLLIELTLMAMWERIGEVLKKMYSAYQFGKNMVLAPIGVVLDGV